MPSIPGPVFVVAAISAGLAASTLALAIGTASASQLRYAEDQTPAIVNPLFTTSMTETRVAELLFQSLYTDDHTLAAVPQLAESGELSADRQHMTVRLREDVTWQDGTAFTARDVVLTVKAMKDPATASTEAARVAFIADVRESGTSAVEFDFVRPELRPEDKLTFKILPAAAVQTLPVKRTSPFRLNPIGTGPWSLAKFNDDNSISFSANPSYKSIDGKDNVGISQIVLKEIADKNYQAKLLLYESVDALVRVLPRDLAMLQSNRKVELYPYQTNSWWYGGFNLQRAPFDDPKVRQAFSQMLNVPDMLAPIGTGELITGPYVPSSPYYNHATKPWPHDTGGAAALLTAAGYQRTSEGWYKAGKKLQITVSAPRSFESAQEVTINLQSQLQAQGIGVAINFLDDPQWRLQVWKDRDFDFVLSQWTFDRNEDIREQFYSTGSRNLTGLKDAELDKLFDTARGTADPIVRKAAFRQVHQRVHDAMPMVFLWTLDSYAALSTRVKNVTVHPFGFFTWANEWQMQ